MRREDCANHAAATRTLDIFCPLISNPQIIDQSAVYLDRNFGPSKVAHYSHPSSFVEWKRLKIG